MRDNLQSLHRMVPGIQTAPNEYPPYLNANELPLVLCWPSEGSSHQEATGSLRRQDRTWSVRVYIRPVSQGLNITQTITTGMELMQAFIETYIDPKNIALLNSPTQQTIQISRNVPVRDSGISVLPYASSTTSQQGYIGFEMLVSVYEKW